MTNQKLYTETELVDLCTQILSSLGHGPDILYCNACHNAIKEPGFDYCDECKCIEVCNEVRNDSHGTLCTYHADLSYESAYGAHIDRLLDADRERAF